MNSVTKHRLVANAVPNSPKPAQNLFPDISPAMSVDNASATSSSFTVLPEFDVSAATSIDNACASTSLSKIDIISQSGEISQLRQLLLSPIQNSDNITLHNSNLSGASPNASKCTDPASLSYIGCSTPISHSLRRYTPRKLKLAKQLKLQKNYNKRLSKKYANIKIKLKKSRSLPLNKRLIRQGVEEKLANFIHRQVKLSEQKSKRYTIHDKIKAYHIFAKSKAAYRALREILNFPSERTLQRFIASKLCSTGLDEEVIGALKKVLLNKPDKEKYFSLVLDETSIKPCLEYDKKKRPCHWI